MLPEHSTPEAHIQAVRSGDAPVVSQVIIEMLRDSPLAFGESLAEAQSRTEQDWQDLVEHLIAPAAVRAAFLASDEEGACGFVCADMTFTEAPPNTVVVSRLWVAPRQRGSGLGRRLMGSEEDKAGQISSA